MCWFYHKVPPPISKYSRGPTDGNMHITAHQPRSGPERSRRRTMFRQARIVARGGMTMAVATSNGSFKLTVFAFCFSVSTPVPSYSSYNHSAGPMQKEELPFPVMLWTMPTASSTTLTIWRGSLPHILD